MVDLLDVMIIVCTNNDMKIIFLDIDGVLNSFQTQPKEEIENMFGIHKVLVERLNDVVRKTDAKVVLSSTWRHDKNWRKTMKESGLDFKFLDKTPDLRGEIRGNEIQKWLDKHQNVEKFCIIDDDSDMLPEQKHFKTSIFLGGLTESICEEIIKYLNENESNRKSDI